MITEYFFLRIFKVAVMFEVFPNKQKFNFAVKGKLA